MSQTLTPTGLLSVDQIAVDTGNTPRNVRRAIARGKLKAVLLTPEYSTADQWNSGHLRVTGAELERYIASGAPDWAAPTFAQDWFVDPEYRPGEACAAAMAKAAELQIKSDATVLAAYNFTLGKTKRLFDDVNRAQNVTVQLSASAEILAAASLPIAGTYPEWLRKRYPTGFKALCVSSLRSCARSILSNNGVASAEKLYGPDYAATAAAALEMLKSRKCVVFSQHTKIPDGPEIGGTISVTYELPFSAFKLSNVVEDAF